MTSDELRKRFLDYFKSKDHTILPGSSLISVGDPSVLFTTAGMQQFKPYYTDPKAAPAPRIATVQPTFRTSDIESVGDETHLTFFEMLGNFALGDYFKKEAIGYAWEFITRELGVDAKRVSITVFGGDNDVPFDEESVRYWEALGVPEKNIQKGTREDNFWGPTGDEGPCGPTTEVIIDGVEVWNIVFNEYYCEADGSPSGKNKRLRALESKGVDTGMGLERLALVLQNKKNVYETDLYQPILEEIEAQTGKLYTSNERSFHIIADHIRGIVFLISEGLQPGNKERPYVLRRLIRRAVAHGRLIGSTGAFLPKVAEEVLHILGPTYPKIADERDRILQTIQEEETRFAKNLHQGMRQFERVKTQYSKEKRIPGDVAFQLYDTFGFPVELLEELSYEAGFAVDIKGFHEEMQKQQKRARAAGAEQQRRMADIGEELYRAHTAAHMLHQALIDVLGAYLEQRGQDLKPDLVRYDIAFPRALTEEEVKKVEALINEKIQAGLPVENVETTYQEAKKMGAIGAFEEKYHDGTRVTKIGQWSIEFDKGGHVKNTKELGEFTILKEESSGAGVRRIRAKVG